MSSGARSPERRGNEPESLSETRNRLVEALERSTAESDRTSKSSDVDISALVTDGSDTLERAIPGIRALRAALNGDLSIEDSQREIDDLRVVIDEATDLLKPIDLTAIPDAVELDELHTVIDTGEIPGVVAGEDPDDIVDFWRLVKLVNFGELFQSVNLPELLKEKGELKDSIEDDMLGITEDGATNADNDAETVFNLRECMEKLYDFTQSASDKVTEASSTSAKNQQPSRNPMTFSSVPSTRPDIAVCTQFSTIPRR